MFSTVQHKKLYKTSIFNGLRGSWGNYMYNNVDSKFGTDITMYFKTNRFI
jgi:hypothetical protein